MLHRKSFLMCPKCIFIDNYPLKVELVNGYPKVENLYKCQHCNHQYDEKSADESNRFILWPRFDVIEFIQDNVLEALFLKAWNRTA